jgi:ribulose-bisphosphate carboxylase large chain
LISRGSEDDKTLREAMYITPESVDPDQQIVALYYVEGVASLSKMAEECAIENSTGTWTLVGYETLEVRRRYGAKICRLIGSDGAGYVQLAIEASNYDPEIGGINCLLSDIAGNIFDMKILNNVKLLDLNFPKYWLEAYKGAKFGLQGTKRLAGIEKENRPVIGAITKPNVGLDVKTYAKLAYETALGGIDFIKDDEALVSPKYCPLQDRVSAVMEAIDRAKQQTGKEVLYAVNITTRQDKLLELGEKAVQAGANHLMVCGPYVGFGGIQALAEDPSINVPIHTHRVGHAAFTRNPKHGIDVALWS